MSGPRESDRTPPKGRAARSSEPSGSTPDDHAANASSARVEEPSFAGWMGSMWLYTGLRFGLFFALWGILYLCQVPAFFAALLGLILSIPLSLVLLAKPRDRFTRQLELRVEARKRAQERIGADLDPDAPRDEF